MMRAGRNFIILQLLLLAIDHSASFSTLSLLSVTAKKKLRIEDLRTICHEQSQPTHPHHQSFDGADASSSSSSSSSPWETPDLSFNVTAPKEPENDDEPEQEQPQLQSQSRAHPPSRKQQLLPRKMDLMWCSNEFCRDAVRERVLGPHNQIYLSGPATGQVAYQWNHFRSETTPFKLPVPKNQVFLDTTTAKTKSSESSLASSSSSSSPEPTVLLMVKQVDTQHRLLGMAARAVQELTSQGSRIHVLLEPTTAARLKHYHGVDGPRIHLWEVKPTPGFGSNLKNLHKDLLLFDETGGNVDMDDNDFSGGVGTAEAPSLSSPSSFSSPDLICTLGGDGLLMHVGMMFQGPVPPILCVSGGSMGFLTPFWPEEMVPAIRLALGVVDRNDFDDHETEETHASSSSSSPRDGIDVYPPNMHSYPYEPLLRQNDSENQELFKSTFGLGNRICLSIRMRLECRVLNAEGMIRARYNVLNEVVIDRGSSPYLAALECFVDDVHLTTVQADGVIFATPTGSTAYSLAAGSSVVHPAVPCILVTPICPHVLSFRSMVFPDNVVLRCYVPEDARSEASVAFDGKHRQALARGDSVQVQMSPYPVPTINKVDHSADWLSSLKRSFNFNTRARQEPL